jgi:membrane protease YdiL (CAAX protease family)
MTDANPAALGPPSGRTSVGDDTALYFLVAISLCAVAFLPTVLAQLGVLPGPVDRYMVGAPLAVFSPTIASVVASRAQAGREGIRAHFLQLRSWPANPLWYVLALAMPGLVFLVGRGVYGLLPGNLGGPWFYFPTEAQHVAAMFIVPVAEEIGWRGFALPRMQRRYGAVKASLLLGLLWGLWHVPMFLATGAPSASFLWMGPYFVAGSVMFTWFYNRTGGSLPLAILLHVGAHLDAPGRGGVESLPLMINTLALVALALVLILVDRRAFQRGPIA